MNRLVFVVLSVALSSCGEPTNKQPDLPTQSDRWVDSLYMQNDSVVTYVGRTSRLIEATDVKPIAGKKSVRVGENIEGIVVGAIRCSFFNKDAYYAKQQFMWRGRWGCQAGRNRYEIENAVKEDGSKSFDYINISPIAL